MPKPFQKITIVARPDMEGIHETVNNLFNFLQQQKLLINCELHTKPLLETSNISTVNQDELGKDVDLIIVVGGDGSLLKAAKNAAVYGTPLLGINRGRLGFLTDIRPSEINTRLAAVLRGDYWLGERFLLQASLSDTTRKLNYSCALNDVVLSTSQTPHMLEFEIYTNDQFICSHRADGLIVATPTGSTAYALSGGGPILHPDMNALVMLPMFSHTLSSRPIVVSANHPIRIKFSPRSRIEAQISCDGNSAYLLTQQDEITIQKHADPVYLAHPLDYNYYETLRSKLYWGQHLST